MTPLSEGATNSHEIVEAANVSHLTALMRQLADHIDKEADFMESALERVSLYCACLQYLFVIVIIG